MRYLIITAIIVVSALFAVQACGGFDADSDGFFTDPLLCGGPLFDCEDSNREVGHGQIYYLDCDNDGLGDPDNLAYLCDSSLCGSDDGRIRGCPVRSNSLDCNDRPPEGAGVGSGIPVYPDCDGDGLGDPSRSLTYCPNSNNDIPTTLGGCTLVLNGDDCNDNPFNLEAPSDKLLRYWDCDGDGHGDEKIGTMYVCPNANALPPRTQNIKDCAMVGVPGDCDDSNPAINSTLGGC